MHIPRVDRSLVSAPGPRNCVDSPFEMDYAYAMEVRFLSVAGWGCLSAAWSGWRQVLSFGAGYGYDKSRSGAYSWLSTSPYC